MKRLSWVFVLLLGLSGCLQNNEVEADRVPESDLASGVDHRVDVDRWIGHHLDETLAFYRDLHAHPELSGLESRTAERVAEVLQSAGYAVTTGVGGTGVVGLLVNGSGPVLMIRGDMDALPVTEKTALPYASEVRSQLADGREVGVMHACGHDVHVSNLVAVAQLLAAWKTRWSGTLLIVAQPAEETGAGARAMIDQGLFERFPRPDFVLALHVEPELPAGQIGYTSGWAMANVDSVDVTFYGRSGHGARPHRAIDPILTASHFVVALQSIVSRRIDPQVPAVVTVGVFRAGTKRNQIPETAHLELTVRSYSDAVRDQLLTEIERIAKNTCQTFDCPKLPDVVPSKHYTPAAYNDPALTEQAVTLFERVMGPEAVVERPASMGGEDFGRYSRELGVPGLMFRLGAQPPSLYADSRQVGGPTLPSLHSSTFAPDAELSLEVGVRAMALLALELLGPGR